MVNPDAATPRARSRLSKQAEELRPWRRAESVSHCFLYWMPVSSFPIPAAERAWALDFFSRFSDLLKDKFGLRPEVFLQYKTAAQRHDEFIRTAREFSPLIGLSRRFNAPISRLPTPEQLRQMADENRKFDLDALGPDYCYWFLKKAAPREREVFLGTGGVTQLFRKSDPRVQSPQEMIPPQFRRVAAELFTKLDVDNAMSMAVALSDSFQADSKRICGNGLEHDTQFEFTPYILPLMTTQDFISLSPQETDRYFQLFTVYVGESTADKGFVMASSVDLDEDLNALIAGMRRDGQLSGDRE